MKWNLSRREQIGLACGIVALLLVVFMLIYVPMGPKKRYERSLSDLESLRNQLRVTRLLKADEAARLRNQAPLMKRLEARPANFELFSAVDKLLKNHNLKDRASLKDDRGRNQSPKQLRVRLELEGVSLAELVDFLYTVHASENLMAVYKVNRLTPHARNQGLDCDLVLVSVKA